MQLGPLPVASIATIVSLRRLNRLGIDSLSTYGKETFEGIYESRPSMRGPKGSDGYSPIISARLTKVGGMQISGAFGHQTDEVAYRVSTLGVANEMNFMIPVPPPVVKSW